MFRLFLIYFPNFIRIPPYNPKLDLSANLIGVYRFFPYRTSTLFCIFLFKKIKASTFIIIQILNKVKVLLSKLFFKTFYLNIKHIILVINPKSITTDGLHPKEIIHSNNKYLNDKFSIKIYNLNFIMPIIFNFTPVNYNYSHALRKLIFIIASISILLFISIQIKVIMVLKYIFKISFSIISLRKNQKLKLIKIFFSKREHILYLFKNCSLPKWL